VCRCVATRAVQYSVSLCRHPCCTVQCVAVSPPVLYSTVCPATTYLRQLLSLFLTSDTRELTQRPPVLRFPNFEICVMYSMFSETVVWRSWTGSVSSNSPGSKLFDQSLAESSPYVPQQGKYSRCTWFLDFAAKRAGVSRTLEKR
jgi:hypothetical protein